MKIRTYLFIIIFTFTYKGFSQEVLLEQNVLNDTVKDDFGPNLENYYHFYAGYGLTTGQPAKEGGDLNPGQSHNFEIGGRYKYKISNFFSLGTILSYNSFSYSLSQKSGKILPDGRLHKSENLSMYCLSYSYYNRFNYGKRGNYIGKFVDIGITGNWCFSNRHLYKDDLGSGVTARTSVRGQKFFEPFSYGLFGNLGFNRYVLTFKYRMSDVFKPKYNFPQPPPITIGLQIGFHQ